MNDAALQYQKVRQDLLDEIEEAINQPYDESRTLALLFAVQNLPKQGRSRVFHDAYRRLFRGNQDALGDPKFNDGVLDGLRTIVYFW